MGITSQASRTRRLMLAGVLAAFAVALIAGSALPASTNLVKNGSFEKDGNGDGIPNNWDAFSLTPADKRVCNQSKAGDCSFKIVGTNTGKALAQTNSAGGLSTDEFTVSVWAKAKNMVNGAGYISIVIAFNHTGGGVNLVYLDIPEGNYGWTLYQTLAAATEDYDSIEISLASSIESGKVWVDKVKLVEAP